MRAYRIIGPLPPHKRGRGWWRRKWDAIKAGESAREFIAAFVLGALLAGALAFLHYWPKGTP